MVVSIEDQTTIIEEEVRLALTTLLAEAKAIFPDDGLPGDVKLRGDAKRDALLAMVTDMSDFPKLLDPDYEKLLRAGLEQPPVSPRLLNLLSIPGQFSDVSREIIRLAKQEPA